MLRPAIALAVLATACVGQPDDDISADPDGAVAGDPDAAAGGADAGPVDPDAAPTACARVSGTGGSGLNLREGPGTGYAVITTMPEGATVELTGATSDVWREVVWQTQQGWASGDYLVDLASCGGGGGHGGVTFLLPWTADVAYYVTQDHNTGSHTGGGAWAWDFGMATGTPILAAHDGTVRRVRGDSTTGCCSSTCSNDANYVVVDRGDGLESLYLHLSSAAVVEGQVVSRGDLVGYSGETGYACGAHLHFQIQQSPSGGGTTSWYNQSVHEYFWDTGAAWDPLQGDQPVSKNGVIDLPAPAPGPMVEFPEGTTGDWDRAMRAAANQY